MVLSEVPNAFSAWLIFATKAASIGAYVVQWFELFDNISEEIEYLWRTPTRFVTRLYAWSRYFPLFMQLVNLNLSYLVHTSPNPRICMVTFSLKAVTAQLMTTCVEMILAVRVHALYNCSYHIGIFLAIVMFIGTSLEVVGTTMSVQGLEPGPKGTICIPEKSRPTHLMIFASGCALIQITLLIMTLSRVATRKKLGWLRTPVVSLMLRDSVGTFLMLAVIVVSIIVFEMIRNEGVLVWNVVFSWYIALSSIIGCRLILNMRTLVVNAKRHDGSRQSFDETPQFSSIFEEDYHLSATGNVSVQNDREVT